MFPRFPWSGRRGKANHSGDLKNAFNIISNEMIGSKGLGEKTVVLAGHSQGTQAAVAYMLAKSRADAVIGIAPEHFVDNNFHFHGSLQTGTLLSKGTVRQLFLKYL